MKKIIKLFENGSVSVCGKKGTGKDILFANVIARRNLEYVSNLDYKCDCKFNQFNINDFNVNNTYDNFLNYNVNYFDIKYDDNVDIYLSDCGIYFPTQYCSELDKKYRYFPIYMSLSRQINNARVHTNAQTLNRVWTKISEHSETYIKTIKTIVIFGFVIQHIRIYDKYESCLNNVPPLKIKSSLFLKKEFRNFIELEKAKYKIQNGDIKDRILIYKNLSNYDTRFFKEYLKNGKKIEEKK